MKRSIYVPVALVMIAGLMVSACGGKSESKTVTVPRVPARNVVRAYRLLHEAGLKVAIPGGLLVLDHSGQSLRIRTKAAPGAIVERGSIVMITFRPDVPHRVGSGLKWIAEGHTGFVFRSKPPANTRVPDFVGAPLTELDRWTSKHGFFWVSGVAPALPASDRSELLDNYVVKHQSPASGATLSWPTRIAIDVQLALRPAS
jgi:beta-lactam-binding protein with PASTA domain